MPLGQDWTVLPLPALLRGPPLAPRPMMAAEVWPCSQGAGPMGLKVKAFATCHLLWYDLMSWGRGSRGPELGNSGPFLSGQLLPGGAETQGSAWVLLQLGMTPPWDAGPSSPRPWSTLLESSRPLDLLLCGGGQFSDRGLGFFPAFFDFPVSARPASQRRPEWGLVSGDWERGGEGRQCLHPRLRVGLTPQAQGRRGERTVACHHLGPSTAPSGLPVEMLLGRLL